MHQQLLLHYGPRETRLALQYFTSPYHFWLFIRCLYYYCAKILHHGFVFVACVKVATTPQIKSVHQRTELLYVRTYLEALFWIHSSLITPGRTRGEERTMMAGHDGRPRCLFCWITEAPVPIRELLTRNQSLLFTYCLEQYLSPWNELAMVPHSSLVVAGWKHSSLSVLPFLHS